MKLIDFRRLVVTITVEKTFADIMASLFTYFRIIQNYQNTPRYYGIDELLFPAEAHIIETIGDNLGLSLNELAEKTYRTKSAMSMTIKSLANKKLVKRKRDKDDNRRYVLTLTEEGQKVYDYHRELDLKNYKEILKGMTTYIEINEEELKITNKIIDTLNKVSSKTII